MEHEAQELADQDVEINTRMSKHGAAVVPSGANVIHHCNTGALATVDVGTALGVITECHSQGKGVHVWVDETRPRLQGARLTAFELQRAGVPMHLISDSASGQLMQDGKVDIVLFGADRVASNGDCCNKIGTYNLSVVARENGVPVYAVVPTSTIDLSLATGKEIPIEERSADEVTTIRGVRVAPQGVQVYNPAFDVTPFRYLTGIVTEEGICYPPFRESLKRVKERAEERAREQFDDRVRGLLSKPAPTSGAAASPSPAKPIGNPRSPSTPNKRRNPADLPPAGVPSASNAETSPFNARVRQPPGGATHNIFG